MADIVFTPEQRAALGTITSGGFANFAQGYSYLKQELLAMTSTDLAGMGVTQQEVDDRVYWLTQAIEINQNDLSDLANNFIRDITRYGLQWDGKPTARIQQTSDAVGEAVIRGILQNDGKFMPIDDVVGHDVQAAISSGGQTIGGWGGAFYYWPAPFEPAGPDATVGSTILADAGELEKFISIAACTTYNALHRSFGNTVTTGNVLDLVGDLWSMAGVLVNAAVPLDLKTEIRDRVYQYVAGTRQYFSDDSSKWEWQNALDLSNALGISQTGQHGFKIDFTSGWVLGQEHASEDFQIFFRIEDLIGSNLGDAIILNGATPLINILAGSGDDIIHAHGGEVVANGGGGFDIFVVNADRVAVNVVRSGSTLTFNDVVGTAFSYVLRDFDLVQFGDVTLSFQDLLDLIEQTINGTAGGDILYGTPGIDVINGLAGNDTIYGYESNDRIDGGTGRDVIAGLGGADQISDPDWLVLDYSASDAGVTVNRGSFTNRSVSAAGGHAQGDAIVLGMSSARLDVIGSEHNDIISFGDQVFAGGGNDTIHESKYIVAGDGYDTVYVGRHTGHVDFGIGGGELILPKNMSFYFVDMDQGIYRRTDSNGITYNLTVLGDFTKITGTNYGDTISGTSGADIIFGGGGPDDVLHGGDGDDYLDGSGTLIGGNHVDTIVLRGGYANGGAGNDIMSAVSKYATMDGGANDDVMTAVATQVTMIGGTGADTFIGAMDSNKWNTVSYAGAEEGVGVTHNGSNGSGWKGEAVGDVLQGNFSFIGSAHADEFNLRIRSYTDLRAGAGNDIIVAELESYSELYGDGSSNPADLALSDDDIITTTGRASGKVYGGRGNDIISGAGELHGDEGADTITSAAGNHLIFLGVDNDVDTFVFSRMKGFDQVYEFTSLDRIQIGSNYKYDSFDDVMANAIQQSVLYDVDKYQHNVEIWFESDIKITIMNYQKTNLTADNFLFD